jgi:ubiquinone/menaquinone biosynthesis C-methylase UbiE
MTLDPSIDSFYTTYSEATRLDWSYFQMERERTQEIVERHLPQPPAEVLDVGGGPGAYSLWLARKGYAVQLVDPVALHVTQAWERSEAQQPHRLKGVGVGDARQLDQESKSADAVLLLGPLYHLTARADRLQALGEAKRVLRKGGVVFAAAISRFASFFDGLRGALFQDPAFERIVRADLHDGQHRNDTGRIEYFTTAFFHKPDEFLLELREAGFDAELYGLEGPAGLLADFDALWREPGSRTKLLDFLRLIEREPSLLGLSAHILAVARPR